MASAVSLHPGSGVASKRIKPMVFVMFSKGFLGIITNRDQNLDVIRLAPEKEALGEARNSYLLFDA